MLVVSRKPGQDVRIGDDIRITVVRVQGNRVVLGIDAPESVRVLRGELSFDPIEVSNDSAGVDSTSKPDPTLSAA